MATKKPKPFDVDMRVAQTAECGMRIGTFIKTVRAKTWEVKVLTVK
jgi:hypothetical protein